MQFHKPDPRAFSGLLNDTGFEPEECVYVGDSLSDAQTANDAGLHFIASLESGLRQEQDFAKLVVDRYVHTFPEVVDAVISLDGSTIAR
jgi:phosphoglycolate phosphatase